jgi:dihydroorotate dehydrogenase
MYQLIRGLLFRLDPENAHSLVIAYLRLLKYLRPISLRKHISLDPRASKLEQSIWGLNFSSPVGLAAGFDKNAEVIESMAALGFGFIEIGTVTPMPQAGNPRPRLFRHPQHNSLQNSLGFNNRGLKSVKRNLQRLRPRAIPVGINIGKNKDTPLELASEDYLALLEDLSDWGDYFVVNISSPNTPALRDLQKPEILRALLRRLRSATEKPLLVKLAPDLEAQDARRISNTAVSEGADGLILTNTTTNYDLIPGAPRLGGLSGQVLAEASLHLLRIVASELHGQCPIISVGGIASAEDALQRFRLGASLVQLYTALVFKGPALINEINSGILKKLDHCGFDSIKELQGLDIETET